MAWRESFADGALRYTATGKIAWGNAEIAGPSGRQHGDHGGGHGGGFWRLCWPGKLMKPGTQKQMLSPQVMIRTAHQFPTLDTTAGEEGARAGLGVWTGLGSADEDAVLDRRSLKKAMAMAERTT